AARAGPAAGSAPAGGELGWKAAPPGSAAAWLAPPPAGPGREVVGSPDPAAGTGTPPPSPRAAFVTAPQEEFGFGGAELETSWAASLISNRARSEPPWMDSSTPWAPSMLASSSGLEMAISAAATDRSSPRAEPIPISAEPAPDMTDFTSAKSRLI